MGGGICCEWLGAGCRLRDTSCSVQGVGVRGQGSAVR